MSNTYIDLIRTAYIEMLHSGIIEVTFTKKDGTDRVMKCTLKEDLIPKDFAPKGTGRIKKTQDNISVFDLDKQDWRSFTISSVKTFIER